MCEVDTARFPLTEHPSDASLRGSGQGAHDGPADSLDCRTWLPHRKRTVAQAS